MTQESSVRAQRAPLALVALVAFLALLQLGVVISLVSADIGGGTASTTVTPDTVSDQVAATAAEFRVDESGAATYSIPIYTAPGTAGVAPKLALSYSSQGGNGPMGKGWSVSGLSSISRCRATREAGDFIVGGVATDGVPTPVNFSSNDRYCLDGQRLIPAQAGNAACKAISGIDRHEPTDGNRILPARLRVYAHRRYERPGILHGRPEGWLHQLVWRP